MAAVLWPDVQTAPSKLQSFSCNPGIHTPIKHANERINDRCRTPSARHHAYRSSRRPRVQHRVVDQPHRPPVARGEMRRHRQQRRLRPQVRDGAQALRVPQLFRVLGWLGVGWAGLKGSRLLIPTLKPLFCLRARLLHSTPLHLTPPHPLSPPPTTHLNIVHLTPRRHDPARDLFDHRPGVAQPLGPLHRQLRPKDGPGDGQAGPAGRVREPRVAAVFWGRGCVFLWGVGGECVEVVEGGRVRTRGGLPSPAAWLITQPANEWHGRPASRLSKPQKPHNPKQHAA